jgi:AraC-like DNA-binding protein
MAISTPPSPDALRPGWDLPPPPLVRDRLSRGRFAGLDQGWPALAAVFDMPHGVCPQDFPWDRVPGLGLRLNGARVRLPGSATTSGPGRNITFWPGGPNRMVADGPIRFATITLPGALFERAAEALEAPPLLGRLRDDLHFVGDPRLHELAHGFLHRAFCAGTAPSRLEMEARALLLVDHLLHRHDMLPGRRPTPRPALAAAQLRRAQEVLEAHLDRDISLSQVAAAVGVSPSHLARGFRLATGLPPHQWLVARRLERARNLLQEGRLSLAEVALRCGFADQSHLTHAFRRAHGVPPGQWRRLRRE